MPNPYLVQVLYEQDQEENLNLQPKVNRNIDKIRNNSITDFDGLALCLSKAIIFFSIAYLMWTIGTVFICWNVAGISDKGSESSESFCSNFSPKLQTRELKSLMQNINEGPLLKVQDDRKQSELKEKSEIQNNEQSQSTMALPNQGKLNSGITDSRMNTLGLSEAKTEISNNLNLEVNSNQKNILYQNMSKSKITNERYLKIIQQFAPSVDLSEQSQQEQKGNQNSGREKQRPTLSFLSKEQRDEAINRYLESVVDQKSVYLQFAFSDNQNQRQSSKSLLDRMKWLPSLDQYQEKNSLCVVLSTYNNAHQGQITRTLDSISSQQYEKYHLVIVDGGSSDGTTDIVKEYIKLSSKLSERTVVLQGSRNSELESVYQGLAHCNKGQIAVSINGQAELLGPRVFQLTDYTYSFGQTRVVYSDAYRLDINTKEIEKVRAAAYDESEKFMNLYRDLARKYGYYFSFNRDLLELVDKDHLTDSEGEFYAASGNKALLISLLQVACGDIAYVSEPLLLHSFSSNRSERQLQRSQRQSRAIANKKKLHFC